MIPDTSKLTGNAVSTTKTSTTTTKKQQKRPQSEVLHLQHFIPLLTGSAILPLCLFHITLNTGKVGHLMCMIFFPH